ncbi:hypothetical protein [Oceanobacter kriegii]|nr:hypothetical protein [Oceanobacter kriegii]
MTELVAVTMAAGVAAAIVLGFASDVSLQEWRFGHSKQHDDHR